MPDFGEYNILFEDESIETIQPIVPSPSIDYGEYSILFDETPVEPTPPTPTTPQPITPSVTPRGTKGREAVRPLIEKYSNQYGLEPTLMLALTEQESAYDPQAVSRVGARGLMQIMPATGKDIARELGVSDYDLNDPETNVMFGTYYLKKMMDRYDGDIDKALAAYNAGPGNVDKYNGIPPFKETQKYVKKIKERQSKFTSAPTPTTEQTKTPSPISKTGGFGEYDILFDTPPTEIPETPEQPVEEPQQSDLGAMAGRFINTLKSQPKNIIRGLFSDKDAYRQRWDDAKFILDEKAKSFEDTKRRAQHRIQSEGFTSETKQTAIGVARDADKNLLEVKKLLRGLKVARKDSEKVYSAYDKIIKSTEEAPLLQETPTRDLAGAKGVVQDLSGALAELVGSIATGVATGPISPLILGERIRGAQQKELEEKGVAPDKRAILSLTNALIQAPLESIGAGGSAKFVEKTVGKYVKNKIINKAATGFILEATTEFVQKYPEAITNFIGIKGAAKTPEEKEKVIFNIMDVTKAAAYEGFLGGFTGGLAGGGRGAIESFTSNSPEVTPEVTPVEPAPVVEPATQVTEEVEPVSFGEDFDNVETFNQAIQDNLNEGNTSVVKALMRNLTPEEHTELKTLRETSKQAVVEEVVEQPTPEDTKEDKASVKTPDIATEKFDEFEKWQINKIKEATEGMSELERADWVLENGAGLRAEFKALQEKPKPKKRVKIKLEKKTPVDKTKDTERGREKTSTKISKLENIRDNLIKFNSKEHQSMISQGFVEKVGSGKDIFVTLTDMGSDRIGELQTGFNRGKVDIDKLKTIDEDLQRVAGFDTQQIDHGFKNIIEADSMDDLMDSDDFIDTYHTIGRQKIAPTDQSAIKDNQTKTKKMFDTLKKRFPEGKLQLRFGDKNNPVINHKGDIIEDFRDGDYGTMTVNKNGDGLIIINTGIGNINTAATLVHEAVGHYGPDILLASDKKLQATVDKLFKRDKDSALIKELETQYFPDDIKAEWFARVIEDRITPIFNEDGSINQEKLNTLDSDSRTLLQKIKDFFKRLFRGKPTGRELNKLVVDIFKRTTTITKKDTKKSVLITKKQKAQIDRNEKLQITADNITNAVGIASVNVLPFSELDTETLRGIGRSHRDVFKIHKNIDSGSGIGVSIESYSENTNDIVGYRDTLTDKETLTVLFHELGHKILDTVYFQASETTKKALIDDYNTFYKKTSGDKLPDMTVDDFLELRGGGFSVMGFPGSKMSNIGKKDLQNMRSFKEWFSDNTSRWMSTNKKPMSLVDRFFHDVVVSLKRAYNKITKKENVDSFDMLMNTLFGLQHTKTPTITQAQKKSEGSKKEKIVKKAEKVTAKRTETKRRINTFTKDLVKAQTSTDKNKAIVRYTAFAERNLTSSQRGQLLEVVNKIKKADNTDSNYKKANDLINEFHHFRNVTQLHTDFKSVDRKKKITSKDPDLKVKRDSIAKKFDNLTDFETLKRLFDRGLVRRPFLKGTKELSKMGDKYTRVYNHQLFNADGTKGETIQLIDNDIKKGNEVFYHINNKGKKHLEALNKSNEKVLETLDNDILEYKIAVQELKDEISGKKKAREEKLEKAVVGGLESIKGFNERKVISSEGFRNAISFLGTTGEQSASRIDGFTNTDKNGFQKGAITENITNIGVAGNNEKLSYEKKSQNFIINEIKKAETKEGIKIDMSEFSEATHYGVFDRTSDLVRKVPAFKKVLDGKVSRGRVKNFIYRFKNGTFKLNKAQRVSMYLYSLNVSARRHIVEGGIKFKKNDKAIKLTQIELEQVANDVRASKDEMIVADVIFKFFNTVQNIDINKISMEELGFAIASVESFFPISVSKESLQKLEDGFKNVKDFSSFKTNIQSYMRESLPGTLKARTESTKPIFIEDVFIVLARNNIVIAKYIGFAGKINHMVNFLEGIKQDMIENNLEGDFKALQDFVGSLMASGSGNQGERWVRVMTGLYAVKVLGFPNIKVPLKQLPSALAAFPYLRSEARGEMLKFSLSRLSDTKKEMIDIDPYFDDRFNKGVDGDFLESSNAKMARKFIDQKKSLKNYISAEGLMAPISNFDSAVIANIWNAVKVDIKIGNPDIKVGSDEYWGLVKRKTQQIVRWTQPTFDAYSRTQAQKTLVMKPLTFFSTQRIKYFQQFERGLSLMFDKKATVDQHNQGIMILLNIMLVNTMFMAMLDWSWMILRGKLDDEDKRKEMLMMNVIRSAFGFFPVMDKIVDMTTRKIQGTRISQDVAGFDFLVEASEFLASWFIKEKRTSRKKKRSKTKTIIKEGVDVISVFGIPTQSTQGIIDFYNATAEKLEK